MKHTKMTLCKVSTFSGIAILMGSAILAQAQTAHRHVHFTSSQARTIAVAKYPGKVVGKINLENEEGAWQYAVNVRSGHVLREVMVSAMSGKIANVEVTSKAEEARELKAETAKAGKKHKG